MDAPLSALRKFTLRSEELKDHQQIESLLDKAFSGHDEAELVSRIRQTPEYINELSLVATKEDHILGFVMLSYVTLHGKNTRYTPDMRGKIAYTPAWEIG